MHPSGVRLQGGLEIVVEDGYHDEVWHGQFCRNARRLHIDTVSTADPVTIESYQVYSEQAAMDLRRQRAVEESALTSVSMSPAVEIEAVPDKAGRATFNIVRYCQDASGTQRCRFAHEICRLRLSTSQHQPLKLIVVVANPIDGSVMPGSGGRPREETDMPVAYIDLPTGVNENKKKIFVELYEAIHETWQIPDTRVLLRDWANQAVSLDGEIENVPMRPICTLAVPPGLEHHGKQRLIGKISKTIGDACGRQVDETACPVERRSATTGFSRSSGNSRQSRARRAHRDREPLGARKPPSVVVHRLAVRLPANWANPR
jgi:hypothetical protein